MARLPHSFQVSATLRLERARALLAEASGLMRACAYDVRPWSAAAGFLDPVQQAIEIEKAGEEVARILVEIGKSPCGDKVG